jgi:hypothetical protein
MDRVYWNPDNTGPYYSHDPYSQAPQEDGQHASLPETDQTSGGVVTSGPSWSHPASGLPNQGCNVPSWIPPSPRLDLECLLRTPQTITLEEVIPPQPEVGQTSAGVPPREASGSQPALDLPYLSTNVQAQILSSSGPDLGCLLRAPQPSAVEEIIQNDVSLEPPNPRPAVEACRRKTIARGLPPAKERFLAGLEAFGRGALLKDCSSSLRFSNYINSDGKLSIRRGVPLYGELTAAEKTRLDQAIIARQGAKLIRLADEDTVKERFMEGLDNYAQGVKLKDCAATLQYKFYASDDGRLQKPGQKLRDSLPLEEQSLVDQALLCRNRIYRERSTDNRTVEERFLAGLDNYVQGVPLTECSASLDFGRYVSNDGHLQKAGQKLCDSLPPEDQARISQALLSRHDIYLKRSMNKAPLVERFLATLSDYAGGVPIKKCSRDIFLNNYVTDDGYLQPGRGETLYNKLSGDDKVRVDRALTARGRMFIQRTSRDVGQFLATLEPYGDGLPLQQCRKRPGLKRKVTTYLTEEGGLTSRGKRLIENLQPSQRNEVSDVIAKRQRYMELNSQVPEPPWQRPEMSASVLEQGGIDPTATADPMQTEAMWATAWQLTGQAVPGMWGIPSESAESPIPSYGCEAVGADFQHQYGPYGLMPQLAPERLIGRGIMRDTLVNIQGEVYRVHDMGISVNPTNENPQGKQFLLVPCTQGG